ncbi:MAG: serine hydrolase [Pseudomonadota bacterium]
MRRATLVRFLALSAGCIASAFAEQQSGADALLLQLLNAAPENVATVVKDPARHRVQILYTRVIRDGGATPRFETHAYRSGDEYFYPASTVKFPTAVFALEQLHRLGLSRDAELRISPISERLPGTGEESAKSVAQYAHEIFVVSDNDAYNRLYEFLGPEQIEARLHALHLKDTRIVHRLSVAATLGENRKANASTLWLKGQMVSALPERHAPVRVFKTVTLGSSYVDAKGAVIEAPFNFGAKNAFSLSDQQSLLREVFFPTGKLTLSPEDLAFLREEMASLPRESVDPLYPVDEYPDSYVKFLLAGGETSLPEGVTIYNKIGQAYGFTTDNAYIVNQSLGIEFFLAATVFTNENDRFNDDNYEYDEIAVPFLRDLGQLVYNYEVSVSKHR